MPCPHCDDCFWVCENHPEQPWEGDRACSCGGAGMPCKICNPYDEDNPPKELAGSTIIWHRDHGTAH